MSAPIATTELDILRDQITLEEFKLLEKAAEIDFEAAGTVIDGQIEAIRLYLAAEFGPRAAYDVLQQSADRAAMPLIGQQS